MSKQFFTAEELKFRIFIKSGDSEDKILRINEGRQSGHTTALINTCEMCDLIFVHNHSNVQTISWKYAFVKDARGRDSLPKFMHFTSNRQGMKRSHFRYVFVDDFSMIDRTSIGDALLRDLVLLNPKMIVLLG